MGRESKQFPEWSESKENAWLLIRGTADYEIMKGAGHLSERQTHVTNLQGMYGIWPFTQWRTGIVYPIMCAAVSEDTELDTQW